MYTIVRKISRKVRRAGRFLIGKDLLQNRQIKVPTERHGSEAGGWMVARNTLDCHSIVYSIGVGSEISFDMSLIQRYGMTVHAFDPTPRSIEWIQKQEVPEQFCFHPIGIAGFDGMATFYPPRHSSFVSYSLMSSVVDVVPQSVEAPVRRLESIMKELGHMKIDLLKMDIEGAEYEVIQDLLNEHLPVRQILVEFHHRLPSHSIQKTQEAIESFNKAGYLIFSISDLGEEYSFLQISQGQAR